jgi:hypothetical protein
VALFRYRTITTIDRRLSVKLVPTFADTVCHVVIAMDHYGRILDFLDRGQIIIRVSNELDWMLKEMGEAWSGAVYPSLALSSEEEHENFIIKARNLNQNHRNT